MSEKDKSVRESKDVERARSQKEEKSISQRFDKRTDELKREEEKRHQMELENVKKSYHTKLQIEKEKI